MSHLSVISASELRQAVNWPDLLIPVARAFDAYSQRTAGGALQVLYPQSDPSLGDVFVKTGYDWAQDNFVVKVSPWFRVNREEGRPQGGFFAVIDSRTGHTRAILNEEHYLSDIRTAAAGALAAQYLAPARVETACVIGTGTQALIQPQALWSQRRFERLYVWGRDTSRVKSLIARLESALPGVNISAASDVEAAVRSSQVVITATASKAPLVNGAWLSPGQHMTAVGADDPTKCELDAQCLTRADVVAVDSLVDSRENGELYRHSSVPLDQTRLVEIGHILSGRMPGRTSQNQITVAKFVGLGVQDLAAANEALRRLRVVPPPALGACG